MGGEGEGEGGLSFLLNYCTKAAVKDNAHLFIPRFTTTTPLSRADYSLFCGMTCHA